MRDDGVGMPQHIVERVTSGRFVSATERKTGIGLENVKKRLELYFAGRHRFDIVSSPQQGTTVIIEIPVVRTTGEGPHV
ncbi:hypothetical protein SD70_05885 [Gordoniibacillus kamchatkensis]|uniref:Histidine kinase/HSP90-like ATPase domain-containing protein n=1 Tax=Gordoniibacillus kamchatkensis TaxID=1590651 RepID=A0ABR5AL15_9BACL|nr:ATP-binding protein [Paenibacillus sp. VKM B-2647]KIL41646.1 hypothetical protein SD70_05885 [Paenibacillus sp. VKM B-2647]